VVNAWRETVTRGARWLGFLPLVALGVAPVAVFFRPALLMLVLWHGYAAWRFTTSGAPAATSHFNLGLSRWGLRGFAGAGVVLVTLSYEGYRALLIATVAAYLAYLAELSPEFGLSPRRRLRGAALGAAVLCVFVTGDLLLRRWVHGIGWATLPGHGLSALALPFGLLAWLEVDRVRAPGVEAGPEGNPSPIRAWALKASTVVLPFSFGALVVVGSATGGFWVAWSYLDMEPGEVSSAILSSLLCVNGVILWVLRKRSRQTLRRVVAGVGFTHIPLWWFLVFPTQFDAGAWKGSPRASATRSDMAEDLIYSRVLLGKTRLQVVELLGSPGSYRGSNKEFYGLDGHLCEGFLIRFDGGTAVDADFFWCG
jgi:hypothetical protein